MTAARPATAAGLAVQCSPSAARPGQRPGRGYASGKDDYLVRLRKIEGQVRGLQRMVEAGTWCPDVLVQVASVTRRCRRWRSACSATISATGQMPDMVSRVLKVHHAVGEIDQAIRSIRGTVFGRLSGES